MPLENKPATGKIDCLTKAKQDRERYDCLAKVFLYIEDTLPLNTLNRVGGYSLIG
jgi:hypothetical protein